MTPLPTIKAIIAPVSVAVVAGIVGGILGSRTCPCMHQEPQHTQSQLRTESLQIVNTDGEVVGEFSALSAPGSAMLWLGDRTLKQGSSGVIRLLSDVVEETPSVRIECVTPGIEKLDRGSAAIGSLHGLAYFAIAEQRGDVSQAIELGTSLGRTSEAPTVMLFRRDNMSWAWPEPK